MKKLTVIEPAGISAGRKTRVGAYCRVSTENKEQKHSYNSQVNYFRRQYRYSGNEELVEIYADMCSGTTISDRTEFIRMIEDCRRGKLDRIVTKSLSRFARNTRECLSTLRELKNLGISVLFEKEGIDTRCVSDEIMISILEGLAQEESASISRNIRWSIKRKMASGTLGIARVPLGYVKSNGKLLIDDKAADIVRRIYSLYLSGMGAKRIASVFNDEGILSPTGILWNNVTILKILKQEKYIGDICWQKTYSEFMGKKWMINKGERDSYYIRDCLPAIISRKDFVAVQELRERNTRHAHKMYSSIFRGKTKCTCGRSYYYIKRNKAVWRCSGKYDTVNPCLNPVFFDNEYHLAWRRLCFKLRRFADEIILPCIIQCELLENGIINDELCELRAREGELLDRRYALYSLCSYGCLTAEKLAGAEVPLNAELDIIKKQLERLENNSIKTSEKLGSLYSVITREINENIADEILLNVVSDGMAIEFELIGGLKLREIL